MRRQLRKIVEHHDPGSSHSQPDVEAVKSPSRRDLTAAPLGVCYVGGNFEEGVGHVVVSRLLVDGSVAAAVFLVDTWCVGVKDAFTTVLAPDRFQRQLIDRLHPAAREVSPAFAAKLVSGAVQYADSLGLKPHPAYIDASVMLEGIDVSDCLEAIVFGKNGKPCFIAGPSISPVRTREVVDSLTQRLGPDGFTFVTQVHQLK